MPQNLSFYLFFCVSFYCLPNLSCCEKKKITKFKFRMLVVEQCSARQWAYYRYMYISSVLCSIYVRAVFCIHIDYGPCDNKTIEKDWADLPPV